MNGYPILEYDSTPRAVLQPDHEDLGISLPESAAFPFVGDCVDDYARQHKLPVLGEYVTINKRYPVYRVSDEVCLCQAPMGAPVAAAFMDWLIAYGVRRVVTAGSCGALIDLPENAFVLPRRALRDEGTSYHYMPPARWIELESGMRRHIAQCMSEQGYDYVECDTWTTDAIFRETVDSIRRYRAEGCGVVDMECAALAACAEFRGIDFGQFLYTADTLANADAYDARGWGEGSLVPALKLCLKALGV
ncbi:MAG: nucleoside phosphorylase [Clostridia bacterium]|nr:nucleoside phosphorylase [Clostridia bacterium]